MEYILIFIVGLLFGSFSSVILHRLGEEVSREKIRSVLVGRSHCPHCHHTLAWYDLFPLFSWLMTGGKCRYCKTRIGKRYPLLEIGGGLIFLGTLYWRSLYGGADILLLIIFLFLNRSFYILMMHDIKTMYLHPVGWRFSIVGGAVLLFYKNSAVGVIEAAQRVFIFALLFLLLYRLAKLYVRLRRKHNAEGIGQGDVMLAPIIGVVIRKVYTLTTGSAEGMNTDWFDIIQIFRYYVIIACLAALLLLLVTPITKEGEKRLIPFFPGMIVGVWIMMMAMPRVLSLFY